VWPSSFSRSILCVLEHQNILRSVFQRYAFNALGCIMVLVRGDFATVRALLITPNERKHAITALPMVSYNLAAADGQGGCVKQQI
jgi:hypothetical protein